MREEKRGRNASTVSLAAACLCLLLASCPATVVAQRLEGLLDNFKPEVFEGEATTEDLVYKFGVELTDALVDTTDTLYGSEDGAEDAFLSRLTAIAPNAASISTNGGLSALGASPSSLLDEVRNGARQEGSEDGAEDTLRSLVEILGFVYWLPTVLIQNVP